MSYIAPLHLVIVRSAKLANDRDVDFWTAAVATQLRRDVAPAWGLPPPGVFTYTKGASSPAHDNAAVIAIVDDDGDDEAAGYHSVLGKPYGFVDIHQSGPDPSIVLSHEAIELFANAYLDRWAPGPDGLSYAVELCDAVQRDGYLVDVELFGERRGVKVSDFVLPAWFKLVDEFFDPCRFLDTDGQRQARDFLSPFELSPGGYAIAKDTDGRVVLLSHADGASMAARKLGGRTGKLIAGGG